MSKKVVLSVDPGKASGIAVISWTGVPDELPIVEYSIESQPDQYGMEIRILLNQWMRSENFSVACESFIINAQTVRNSQAPYSLEQIGILKFLCRDLGYDPDQIIFQSPANAKAMFPNPALKTLGTWHRGGEGHANDAIRHGLLCLVKRGWVPRALLD